VSRIGRKPINLPKGVDIQIDGNKVTVKGPKGSLTQELPADISLNVVDDQIIVSRPSDAKHHRHFTV
jgi:large subunit ribosomal protein L6